MWSRGGCKLDNGLLLVGFMFFVVVCLVSNTMERYIIQTVSVPSLGFCVVFFFCVVVNRKMYKVCFLCVKCTNFNLQLV